MKIKKFNESNLKTFKYRVSEKENVYVPNSEHRLEMGWNIVFHPAEMSVYDNEKNYVTEEDLVTMREVGKRICSICDNVKLSDEEGWLEITCSESDADLIGRLAIKNRQGSIDRPKKIKEKSLKLGFTWPDSLKGLVNSLMIHTPDHLKYLTSRLESCKLILSTRKEKIN